MNDEIVRVRHLLETAKRKLADSEKQAYALRAEIAAYEKVCAILAGSDPPDHQGNGSGHPDGGGTRRQRGMSDTWRRVFAWIGEQDEPPETEGVWRFTEQSGLSINRTTLRSQLSVYTTDGVLERHDGRYRLSAKGRVLLRGTQEAPDAGVPVSAEDVDGWQ